MVRRILLLTFLLCSRVAVCQMYAWNPAPFKLNRSGIQIESKATQFQFLDWNGDGMPDFILNDDGHLVYAEQSADGLPQWKYKAQTFPPMGFWRSSFGIFPKNFRFFDWDQDGDFDLAADSSRFWWNTGSNINPIWLRDDSLLAGIPFGRNFSFVDYDQDGDWDATCNMESDIYNSVLFLNDGSNQQPVWTRNDTLIPYGGFSSRFVNLDTDSLFDLITIEILVGTGSSQSAGFGLAGSVNRGTRFNPQWDFDGYALFWAGNGRNLGPGYDLADYDGNGSLDILKTDWQRHLAVHLQKDTSQNTHRFDMPPDELLGPVNVEANARPYILDANKLAVTGDDLVDGFIFLPDGRIRVYESQAGLFDPANLLMQNVPQTEFEFYPNFKKTLTLSFADVDHDGDQDYLMSFIKTTITGFELYKSTLFYENIGTAAASAWQVDSTQFARFQNPDSMFYDPRLVDIDSDGDFDLFIQRNGTYTFYERLNTGGESWRERADWLQGLDDRTHYSAAFVDLSRDGRLDLVFGETNGTLTFYENVGSQATPAWQLLPDVFAPVNVDSLATPAFYRVDPRGIYDLIVGNAGGKLFYFENLSTVDVQENPPASPVTFRLFQNYPNPFNPETTIRFTLPKTQFVQLTIYNLLGQKVTTLIGENMTAGEHAVIWKPGDQPSGLYFARLKTANRSEVRKMILSK